MTPFPAANAGHIDEVIEPKYTRAKVINAFKSLHQKFSDHPARKHGNSPV